MKLKALRRFQNARCNSARVFGSIPPGGIFTTAALPLRILIQTLVAPCFFLGTAFAQDVVRLNHENDRVVLTIPRAELNQTYFWYGSDSGLAYVQWRLNNDEVELISPILRTSNGITFPPSIGLLNSGIAVAPVIGTFRPLEDSGQTIRLDVTDIIKNPPLGLPQTTNRPGQPGKVRVDGIMQYHDGSDLWGVRQTNQATQRSLRRGPYTYTGAPLATQFVVSLVKAPSPMKPRAVDIRMGFFSEFKFGEYGDDTYDHQFSGNATRWRLERLADSGPVGRPKSPIVMYFEKGFPEKWKPVVRKGIQAWAEPLQGAGFANAIQLREFPENLPKVLEESLRFSTINFKKLEGIRVKSILGSSLEEIGGAGASTVVDIRSGEILRGKITFTEPMETHTGAYAVSCGALDNRVWDPLRQGEVLADIVEVVIAHEMGHILGLRDGHFGEYAYSPEKLRDPDWLREWGMSPSVMTYARCNYVAQPEDAVDPEYLLPRVGPSDHHQIKWGYIQFPQKTPPDEVRQRLDEIVKEQQEKPWLRYVKTNDRYGPQAHDNSVDTADPVYATTYGLANLRRSFEMLPQLSVDGSFSDKRLEQLYHRSIERWTNLMTHVVTLIGGYKTEYKLSGDSGIEFYPIDSDEQVRALSYLSANTFRPQRWLLNRELARRFEPTGAVETVALAQAQVLESVLSADRLLRVHDAFESAEGADHRSLSVRQLLETVRVAVWSDLYQDAPSDSLAIEIQAQHLSILTSFISDEYAVKRVASFDFSPFLPKVEPGLSIIQAFVQDDLGRLCSDVNAARRFYEAAELAGHRISVLRVCATTVSLPESGTYSDGE